MNDDLIKMIDDEINWLKDIVVSSPDYNVCSRLVDRITYLAYQKGKIENQVEVKNHNDDFTFGWNGGHYSLPRAAYNEAQEFILASRKIQAIKIIRQHTELGLKDAKDVSECSTLFKQPVQQY